MNLTPRNKVIATAVLAGIVVIALAVVLVVPQFRKMSANQAEITKAESEAQAARTLLSQRQQVKSAAAVTDATLTQLNNAIPENPELPSLIIELQDIAYAEGVSVRSVAPGDPVQEDGQDFIAIPIEIETWGTWRDNVYFLQDLRELARQIRVVDFTATPLPENEAADAHIKMPPYYQVKLVTNIEIYVIPVAESDSSGVPAPAPAPAQ